VARSEFKLLEKLRALGVFRKRRVVLRSGAVSDFYCDIKKAYGEPEILNLLADAIGKRLPNGVTAVAASGYGGLPLAAVVAARTGKKFIAVREKPKSHGLGGWIDGYRPKRGEHVAIIDDVLTSGSSIRATLRPLRRLGARVDTAVVVLARARPKLSVEVSAIYNVSDIFPEIKRPLK
jgi:orotate phosphoribosyltransferase